MARPLRILTIGHSYVVGMNRRLAHEIARADSNIEVTVIAPRYFHGGADLRPIDFTPLADEPCRVEAIDASMSRRVHLFRYGSQMRRIIRDGQFDLVHVWEEPFITAGFQIARAVPRSVPYVIATFQNIAKRYPPPFSWMERYAMSRAAGWIAFANTVAERQRDREGYRDKPMRVIAPGVDTQRFAADRTAGESVLRELNWQTNGPPVIGFLGRFVTDKGLQLMMNALDQLRTPWRVLFVGAGPMEADLKSFAAKHHADDRVRICTNVHHDAVPQYLNAMSVMCAPSQTTPRWREQFGRMLIEAFACGIPVIGSDSGEIPFVLGDAGVVCPERDVSAWAMAIGQMLESPTRRNEFVQRGIARAHEHFAWPVIGRKHVAFFNEIFDQRAGLA